MRESIALISGAGGQPPHSAAGYGCQEARRILQEAGLRNSLGRLKIIKALWRIAGEQGTVSSKQLHLELAESGEPLSLISVRQVLKRLTQAGLVVRDGVDRYRPASGTHYGERAATAVGSTYF
ncbi:hypothetical protein [Zestomonas carbonaria]|uniref:Ferric uptake regulator family protein n=1 Tax=Zestomonas carbonaria TaxID=2762745 RepID=A0A7U7I986_9GAMM|nr:hypothetical protein [Pseudomonas carbonaria]CAD5107481.1 hypothetical protein PSEWESI4_01754 [Pseudomonas carbonaria]